MFPFPFVRSFTFSPIFFPSTSEIKLPSWRRPTSRRSGNPGTFRGFMYMIVNAKNARSSNRRVFPLWRGCYKKQSTWGVFRENLLRFSFYEEDFRLSTGSGAQFWRCTLLYVKHRSIAVVVYKAFHSTDEVKATFPAKACGGSGT